MPAYRFLQILLWSSVLSFNVSIQLIQIERWNIEKMYV